MKKAGFSPRLFHASLAGTVAIDLPRYAELIHHYPETDGPECLLDRHSHRSLLRQRTEHPLGVRRVIDVEQDEKTSIDRKSTRLNSSHLVISYAVFCLKKKKK